MPAHKSLAEPPPSVILFSSDILLESSFVAFFFFHLAAPCCCANSLPNRRPRKRSFSIQHSLDQLDEFQISICNENTSQAPFFQQNPAGTESKLVKKKFANTKNMPTYKE